MKKWLTILLPIILLTACKAFITPNFSESDLVNKTWYCKSSYGTWSTLTEEYYTYKPDSYVTNQGTLTMQKDGYEFAYSFKAEGYWQLQGWYIYEQAQKSQINRAFSKETKQALKNNPALREWEAKIFKNLQTANDYTIAQGAIREIETLTPTMLTTKFNSSYVICAKQ